jgi:hypothetical protein
MVELSSKTVTVRYRKLYYSHGSSKVMMATDQPPYIYQKDSQYVIAR